MSELAQRMWSTEIPGSEPALERTLELARVTKQAASPAPRGRVSRRRLAWAVAIGVLAVLLLASGPGRDVVSAAGRLIGIGDEPTSSKTSPIDSPDVIIGTGESPNGTPFEMVANADGQLLRGRHTGLVGVEFPEQGKTGQVQITLDEMTKLGELHPAVSFGPPELEPDRLLVSGLAEPRAESVEVLVPGPGGTTTSYEAHVGHVTEDLRRKIGGEATAAYFVAFLPSSLVPPSPRSNRTPVTLTPEETARTDETLSGIRVIARDASGERISESEPGGPGMSSYGLFPPLPPDYETKRANLDRCFEETLPKYGTPGNITPDLPPEFLEEVDRCQRRLER